MSYLEIQETLAKFPYYTFPVQADDEEGHHIVITEGYQDVYEDEMLVNMHYYKVFTYISTNEVQVGVYYANGMECITVESV